MRLISLALAAALAFALPAASMAAPKGPDKAAAAADAKAHDQGMAEAPPILQQIGVRCTLTDAAFKGVSKGKDAAGKPLDSKIYEVACQEGLGYMILAPAGGTPTAYDCLAVSVNAPPPGQPDKGGLYCRMAANANPVAGLQPLITKAGETCTVNQGRWMGENAGEKYNQYEAGCSEGSSYVIQAPEGGSTHALVALDCLRLTGDACKYMTDAQRTARIAAMVPAGTRSCQVTGARFVGLLANKTSFYEVACSDQKSGYIFEVDPTGKFKSALDCARATSIGGGCTLTQTAGDTGETSTYARLAKEIGYPCAVTSYKSFGQETKTGRELVELACSDHPEGGFAMLPVDKTQKGEVFNCVRAETRQLKCTLSPREATFAKLTSEISSKGKTCQVTNARGVGVTANGEDYVEAACSGGGGYMIDYAPGIEVVKDVIPCGMAKGIGGGCKLGS